MVSPSVAADPPPAWVATEIAAPPVGSSGTSAALTQWRAHRSPRSEDVLLLGCVATPIPGWVEDMRPPVDARIRSLTAAAAARITGTPAELGAEPDDRDLFALRPVASSGPRLGTARTFVGWDADHVVTCFAICARPLEAAREDAPEACRPNVRDAALDGSAPPPPPGAALRIVTWAVHHPRTVMPYAAITVVLVGALAVASRRRPRTRL